MSVFKFTIGIVTADRQCFKDCIERLTALPDKEYIYVIVADNSTTESRTQYNQSLCRLANEKGLRNTFFHLNSFMEARNWVVKECFTEYLMILDDDDWLAIDAIPRAIDAIDNYPIADMICFGVEKHGRFGKFNQKETIIDSQWKKYRYLNRFKHYSKDRLNKVYLWNAGTLLRVPSIRRYQILWEQPECDDIIPITELYLLADKIVKVNYPIYYYPIQTSVAATKSEDKVTRLEAGMIQSYQELIKAVSLWNDSRLNTFFTKCILYRAISNSINQLFHIDQYYSEKLVNLRKCIF